MHGFADIMGDEHGSETEFLPDAVQQLLHTDAGQCIQCAKRFVQRQDARFADQRAGERHAPPLAAGEP